MELLLYALAFYAGQCVAYVPREAELLLAPLARWRVVAGAGLRVLHPRPSALGAVGARLPFRLTQNGVEATAPLRRLGSRLGPAPPRRAGFDELSSASAAGTLVRVSGRPLVRAASRGHARYLAGLLEAVGRAAPEARQAVVERALRRSLSAAETRRALGEGETATRALRGACDLYLLLALAVAPLALLTRYGVEPLLAGMGLAHLTALALLYRGHRRLWPEAGGERFELLLAAALFPPLLLRTGQELRLRRLAGVHPAALAASLLAGPDFGDYARRRLAALEHAPRRADDDPPALTRVEIDGLLALARERGISATELRAPGPRRDPTAASYCPHCLVDFRPGFRVCSDCGLTTVAHAS